MMVSHANLEGRMLEPQTRAALTEQLKPPSGFTLSYAVGTTFTLDLATALTVPLSFASHHVSAEDDTIGVLDAVRRAADRIDVFAQAGELSMGTRSDLVAFLEPMVHPVQASRGLFHPKVWFLEYRSGEHLTHRFLCASRNLTADRSWDVLVRLDERAPHIERHSDPRSLNQPLVTLLRTLPELCVLPMEAERRANVLGLADRWQDISWDTPDETRSLAFHVQGLRGSVLPDFAGQRALIVSPFLSDDGLRALRNRVRTATHLISRADSLDRLLPASLDKKLTTYVLDDAALPASDSDDADTESAYIPPGQRLAGLHAKIVVVDRMDGSHVFLGSANATRAAWEDNVEVMVELVGSLGKFGVEATLTAMGDLKDGYPTEGGQEAGADEEAERRLEAVVRNLAGVRLSARLIADELCLMRVWADADFARQVDRVGAAGIELRWHLLTRPDLGGTGLALGEEDAATIADIPLTDVTPFIVLIARDQTGRERRTILLARLLDDVPTRRDAIIGRQLTDRAAFVKLLTLLLEFSGVGLLSAGSGASGFFGTRQEFSDGSGLFEALVRAVGAGHHGLADARRIIDFVRDQGDENAVLPPGFDELWSRVWQAHLELTGPKQ